MACLFICKFQVRGWLCNAHMQTRKFPLSFHYLACFFHNIAFWSLLLVIYEENIVKSVLRDCNTFLNTPLYHIAKRVSNLKCLLLIMFSYKYWQIFTSTVYDWWSKELSVIVTIFLRLKSQVMNNCLHWHCSIDFCVKKTSRRFYVKILLIWYGKSIC